MAYVSTTYVLKLFLLPKISLLVEKIILLVNLECHCDCKLGGIEAREALENYFVFTLLSAYKNFEKISQRSAYVFKAMNQFNCAIS